MSEPNSPANAAAVAEQLAEQFDLRGMFFRRKDLADVEQILRTQGTRFDRTWVREQLLAMYGAGDPRLAQWDDLLRDVPAG